MATVAFGSIDFYQALADLLNNDPEWSEIGKDINYSMIYGYDPPIGKSFFLRFENGSVKDVREVSDGSAEAADFTISGPPDVWRNVLSGSTSPVAALTRGQLRVKGKMTQLLKNIEPMSHINVALTKIDWE